MLDGMSPADACSKAAEALIEAGFDSVDYIEVRALDNLELVSDISRPARLFGAARLGKTRLIDNWPLSA